MERYRDRVALVTGAASGLGRGIALGLAKAGARVIAADIDAAGLAEISGRAILSQPLDVRDAASFRSVAETMKTRLGRIDYLFNAAGVALAGELHSTTPEAWRRVIDVNLIGTANGIAAVYPIMVEARHGHIVNLASVAGLLPSPLLAPYAASKAAIVGLTESLRLEAETHGVRVTLVCPGPAEADIDRKAAAPAGRGERAVGVILNGVARGRARIVFPATWRWRLWRFLQLPGARRRLARARAATAGR